ncbi:outer membrane protein [Limoniibacter endophyticus]|uniref:Outer membrane protein n=1 Tax=Limoniibacter endophyticus TaxID=1565040 RepID=A0A8J3GJ68_9HYPH|nr:outer membrane protein [Limoniibacter endophyticus]GHC76211.1 outer membrane protein [Limoniibacter endophyticus]
MRIFIISAATAFLSTSAVAADPIYDIAPRFGEPVAFTWTGGYLGIQGGGGFASADYGIPDYWGNPIFTDSYNGGYLGAFAGWNFALGQRLIVGIEGDLSYNMNETSYFGLVEAGTNWTYGVRGRVGRLYDRALVFASAGWVGTKAYIDTPLGGLEERFSGWSVGAGTDYALTDTIFARAEYRYNDFGSENIGGVDVDLSQHKIGIGLGVKF